MVLVAITLEGRHLGVVRTPEGGSRPAAVVGPPAGSAVFERVDLPHGRVALRTQDGSYLVSHASHDGGAGLADGSGAAHLSTELTQCAAFEEVALPDGQVSLRGCDRRYLGVRASDRLVTDRVVNGSGERFTYLEVPVPLPSVIPQPDHRTRRAPVHHLA